MANQSELLEEVNNDERENEYFQASIDFFQQLQAENNPAQTEKTQKYDVEIFIDLVQGEPCLWNTSTRVYKEPNKKKMAWEKIAASFGNNVQVDFLKSQWKNLKENLKRCEDKRNKLTRSGAAAHKLPRCKYYDNLSFLKDKIINKVTSSNIVLPEPQQLSPLSIATNMANQNVPVETSPSCSLSSSQYTSSLGSPQYNVASYDELLSPPCKRVSTQKTTSAAPKHRKQNSAGKEQQEGDLLGLEMLKTLKEMDKPQEKGDDENCNMLFLKSLFPILDKLPKKKNRRARMKIQEVLFDLEESDDNL